MKQRLKPSERVRKAMSRITRDRAIPASEAEIIITALAGCVTQGPGVGSVVRGLLGRDHYLPGRWMFKGKMVGVGSCQRHEIRQAFDDAMAGYVLKRKNHPGFCDLRTGVTHFIQRDKLWRQCDRAKDEFRSLNRLIYKLKGATEWQKHQLVK